MTGHIYQKLTESQRTPFSKLPSKLCLRYSGVFRGPWNVGAVGDFLPIPSIDGIFTYKYHRNQPNVGIYTIHGWYGVAKKLFVAPRFSSSTFVERRATNQSHWRGFRCLTTRWSCSSLVVQFRYDRWDGWRLYGGGGWDRLLNMMGFNIFWWIEWNLYVDSSLG